MSVECHGLDTPERVHFYEQDFYPLSNFSAFTLMWEGWRFEVVDLDGKRVDKVLVSALAPRPEETEGNGA